MAMDKGTFYDLTTKEALAYCLQLEVATVTSFIPYSLSIAAFLAFWRMNDRKWVYFFRTLVISLALVLPLSAVTYYYDWSIRPQLTAISAKKLLDINTSYPHELADKFAIDNEGILRNMPSTMPSKTLITRLDSLEIAFQAEADTCKQLLSILPDTLATEAYQSYLLKEMGIDHQYATHPTADKDSLMYVQRALLYQRANQTWDTLKKLQRHHKEYHSRTLNTVCIYILYFVFALTGYLLRYKPIKKILIALAMLIVAVYGFQEIHTIIQTHVQKVKTVSKQTVDNAYEEISKQRDKRKAENN